MKETPALIRIHGSTDFQPAMERAADTLLAGGMVAFPTETFYGLAVDVRNEAAIERLFLAKRRPPDLPVLILIPTQESLGQYVEGIPAPARRLIKAFWPGGLTLVFRAGPVISPLLTAGTDKIGIRFSSHPVATALARAIGAPISGTSANVSGQPACRTAREVLKRFGAGIDLILDAGETVGAAASTLVDLTVRPLQILREGVITRAQLRACVADIV